MNWRTARATDCGRMPLDHSTSEDIEESMSQSSGETTYYLARWQDHQDGDALEELLSRHLERIQIMVEGLLGKDLRAKLETDDVVQQAIHEFLSYGPPVRMSNGAAFRGLMARIVVNVIRDEYARFRALRRDMSREQRGSLSEVLDLDRAPRINRTPDKEAEEREEWNRVRLALELLDPHHRAVLIARRFDNRPWKDIADDFGYDTAEAARSACSRAQKKLTQLVRSIRDRDMSKLLDDSDEIEAVS